MGEVLVEFNAVTRGPLRHSRFFEMHAAGSEGNVAIGVCRLGVSSGIITRVGDDEFGKFVLGALQAERIDTTHVEVDEDSPTGIFFVQRHYPIPGKSGAVYYRRDSAASKLSPRNVGREHIASASLLHVSGITPALSASAREATEFAVKLAKENKVSVSFDTNVRLKLWTEDEARTTLLPICKTADILFTSTTDSKIILGSDVPEEIAKFLHKSGVSTVVVKLGEHGAFASSNGQTARTPMISTYVEDPTGAGDAFAAAFLATHLKGWKLDECLRAASMTASLVVSVRGDYENIPDMKALEEYMSYEQGRDIYLR
jgi:2-dehydro-3-deoxygluconokinase/2-dehydro-3-deoxygalactonokinase